MILPLVYGEYQGERFDRIKGQCDLVLRRGKWFLYATVDIPEQAPIVVADFLGIDLGIANIATDSDGGQYSGKPVEKVRRKHNLQRKRLGKKNSKGAKKKLKRIAGKEARFRKHQNHVISKTIVQTAKDTLRGISVEDLNDIRERLPVWSRDARNRLSGWSFAQLVGFLDYKAKLAGVSLVKVDPRNTSRTCSKCQHCEKDNRKSQEEFLCVSCGMSMNADVNAALNIRALADRNAATELASPAA
jgi:putative transposase